ncbi:uncharacterized protein E0L32_003123 [Thyridium curvatum]|uniref:Methyltransferase type 11 domain-containing protein n=1 Tax=Thyridium curvatum TaxID=1093900 RepID=A0A507BLC4_9PEZI|nr:uncharacterized protein E0L32_003123 [Thyridium curvatum]TPX17480.1 hypothetical protein E0L32_003123 [Thyridium curvatum]
MSSPPSAPAAGDPLPDAASRGFRDAASYDAHRPAYPPALVAELLARMRLSEDRSHDGARRARVLELGAGTGKFTAALAAALAARRHEGFEVLAVEPHGPMREQLVARGLPGVRVVEGRAEGMPFVGDEWADGCVVAQAFHWFATEETLRELHRVLKPEAVLGMIWNIEDSRLVAGLDGLGAAAQRPRPRAARRRAPALPARALAGRLRVADGGHQQPPAGAQGDAAGGGGGGGEPAALQPAPGREEGRVERVAGARGAVEPHAHAEPARRAAGQGAGGGAGAVRRDPGWRGRAEE